MRKLAFFAAGFSAAVFLWRYGGWIVALLPVLFLLIGGLLDNPRRLRWLLPCAGMVTALIWCALFQTMTVTPWESRHQEKDVTLTARIDDIPRLNDDGMWVTDARFTDLKNGKHVNGVLYLPGSVQVQPGETLDVIGTIYLADRVSGGEITYFSSRGSFVRFYASDTALREEASNPGLRYWPMQFSARVKETLYELLSEETAPMAAALILGDKSGMDETVDAMSRRAGLAHVMVVSGMHISFLAGLMAAFLGRRKKLSVLVTLLVLCFFALMAGGTPTVWRAVFLCGAGLIAPLTGRENDPPTSLLTALMILLAVNPYAVASVGLQLSFGAVAGMELLVPMLLRRWQLPRKKEGLLPNLIRSARRAVRSTVAVSLGAALFTIPLTAFYFGTVSLLAPLSNLLGLWAVSGAFTISVLAVAVSFLLPGVAGIIVWPAEWLLRYLLWLIPAFGKIPFASVTMTSPYYAIGLVAVYAIVCLNLFWPSPSKKRLKVPAFCCSLLIVACVMLTRTEFVLGDMTVAVLDVGQGQSVCIQVDGKTILVDCGGKAYGSAGNVAADYLADQNIDTVDLLVLTHYHADHTNGMKALLERVEVKEVALPDVERGDSLREKVEAQIEAEGAQVTYITAHTEYTVSEAGRLRIYAPLGSGGSNEMGLAVLASAGDYDVLITGDMNSEVERRLVKYGDLPDIELLVAGHHGSRYSTDSQLLEWARPETAAISVGAGNSYGHPAEETLQRLDEYGVTIYRTDLSGNLVFHTKGG